MELHHGIGKEKDWDAIPKVWIRTCCGTDSCPGPGSACCDTALPGSESSTVPAHTFRSCQLRNSFQTKHRTGTERCGLLSKTMGTSMFKGQTPGRHTLVGDCQLWSRMCSIPCSPGGLELPDTPPFTLHSGK